jgi:GNAT superfamily N-acetyltransferase
MLRKAFTKEERKSHWYVFIMATAVSRRRQGLASTLLANVMERARKDKRPVWLEATTRGSRQLYARHGFETVGEVVLGRGDVGSDGLSSKGGSGVTIWSMYWRP